MAIKIKMSGIVKKTAKKMPAPYPESSYVCSLGSVSESMSVLAATSLMHVKLLNSSLAE